MFPPEYQESVRHSLSESLLGVISQGLIRTMDGKRAAFHDILITLRPERIKSSVDPWMKWRQSWNEVVSTA